VLAIRDDGNPPCEHVVELIERHRADVVTRISELQRLEQGHAALAELDHADGDPSGFAGSSQRKQLGTSLRARPPTTTVRQDQFDLRA
jgi:hypothetical protein